MRKITYVLLTIALIFGVFIGGTVGISLFVAFLADEFSDILAVVFLIPLMLLLFYSPSLIVLFMKRLYHKKLPPIRQWKVFREVPHFGKIMPECWDEVRNEVYNPYITSDGREIPYVMISESQKWVKILDKYFPVDLICGFNEKKREINAIDGSTIKLPGRAFFPEYKEGIKAFFEDRGQNYDSPPQGADYRFQYCINNKPEELYKMDFGKLRYKWENWMTMGSRPEDRQPDIFESVLSYKEMTAILKSVRNRRANLSLYTNIEDYKNEYAICNGITLISRLKYPQNKNGLNFLLDCLNDIDEPYFMMAVDELNKFPHETVKKKLEERAKAAYEENDVLKMAGLMFMAKKLHYEIKYVNEIKERAQDQTIEQAQERVQVGVTAGKN